MDSDRLKALNDAKTLFAPAKTALLVIDKQKAYMDPAVFARRAKTAGPNFMTIVKAMEAFIQTARQKGVPIIWTQMVEHIDLSPPNIRKKLEIDRDHFNMPITTVSPGSTDFDFSGEGPAEGDVVIRKEHYDTFAGTNLADELAKLGVESVVIIGGFASRCVLGSAYGANNNNLHLWVPRDLIILPEEYMSEMAATISIIEAILGYTAESKHLLEAWA